MVWRWLGTTVTEAWLVVASTVVITVAVIAATRLAGLRSFSKLSSFDFAITVAFGSVIASVALFPGARLLNGVIALAALYGFQAVVAVIRRRGWLHGLIDNRPLLLMAGRQVIHENLSRARVTEADIRSKLREANVLDYGQILAVVMEQTGEISVMRGDEELDPALLSDVVGADRLGTA